MQLLVDSSLKVLVEERLQLLILLIEETSLFDEVLPVDKEVVVIDECFVKGSPHAKLLEREDLGHLGPVQSLFLFLACRVFVLITAFRALRFLLALLAHEFLLEVTVFALSVEFPESRREEERIEAKLVLIDLLSFLAVNVVPVSSSFVAFFLSITGLFMRNDSII